MNHRVDQIRTVHAGFINGVVEVCNGRGSRADLDRVLDAAAANGWDDVVAATRRIVAGSRSESLLSGLDDEDATIVSSILEGLRNPDSLPSVSAQPDAAHAAPGLAGIVHAAAHGDTDALRALGGMAEQMSAAGGDMAQLAAVMRRLLNGERDPEQLSEGMGARARGLLCSVIDELNRLDPH